MTTRARSLVLLAVALILFAAMIFFVATRVIRSRRERDVTFGIEQLDVLIEDRRDDEIATMIPWLASRATNVAEALRIVKRAHAFYLASGNAVPLATAAETLLAEFPANPTIRALAMYGQVRAGNAARALELADGPLSDDSGTLYAWTLLSLSDASAIPAMTPQDAEGDDMLLARLGSESAPEDYVKAWRLTGDARYAIDSALIDLGRGDLQTASSTARDAGIRQTAPVLAAAIEYDAGRYDEAAAILGDVQTPSTDVRLRLADALLAAGRRDEARAVYAPMLQTASPPLVALLNTAYLAGDDAYADVQRAVELYPDSFDAAIARVIVSRPGERADALGALSAWIGTDEEANARLAELRFDLDPQRRGYTAALWQFLDGYPSDAAYRYAAWYFASRSQWDELATLLDRLMSLPFEPSAWSNAYLGMERAHAGGWSDAAEQFAAAFHRSPSWQTALDTALALFRSGDQDDARDRLHDALLLARAANGEPRVAVFLNAARASRDSNEVRALVSEALTIRPDSPEALLMQAQEPGR